MSEPFTPFDGTGVARQIEETLEGATESAVASGASILKNPQSGTRETTLLISPEDSDTEFDLDLLTSPDGKEHWEVNENYTQDSSRVDYIGTSPSVFYKLRSNSITAGKSVFVSLKD